MTLGLLYHWTPRENRVSVLQKGLLAGQENRDCREQGMHGVHWPYVCTSPDPLRAWSLLPVSKEELHSLAPWDLWGVEVSANDRVETLVQSAPRIKEVRIYNSIPPDRVRWIGERDVHAGMSIQPVSEWDTDILS